MLRLATIASFTALAASLSAADYEIKALPGLKEELNFKQYSGLMPIGAILIFYTLEYGLVIVKSYVKSYLLHPLDPMCCTHCSGDQYNTSLFFWFVESQQKPESDPVVFWTNGII